MVIVSESQNLRQVSAEWKSVTGQKTQVSRGRLSQGLKSAYTADSAYTTTRKGRARCLRGTKLGGLTLGRLNAPAARCKQQAHSKRS